MFANIFVSFFDLMQRRIGQAPIGLGRHPNVDTRRGYLIKDDGSYLLQSDGSKIIFFQ